MENKYVQALQYTRPSPSLEVVRTVSLHALLSLSSPFHSDLYPVACPLTIFRFRCLILLERRTSQGLVLRMRLPQMVRSPVAQLA